MKNKEMAWFLLGQVLATITREEEYNLRRKLDLFMSASGISRFKEEKFMKIANELATENIDNQLLGEAQEYWMKGINEKIDNNVAQYYFEWGTDSATLTETITVTEASELWGKDVGNLRREFAKGDKFHIGIEVRKSGSTWLVTKRAMERVYGSKE